MDRNGLPQGAQTSQSLPDLEVGGVVDVVSVRSAIPSL
jgi:hypothetical protein